jgi:hypothetical protein
MPDSCIPILRSTPYFIVICTPAQSTHNFDVSFPFGNSLPSLDLFFLSPHPLAIVLPFGDIISGVLLVEEDMLGARSLALEDSFGVVYAAVAEPLWASV